MAEELTNEVFMEVWRNAAKFEGRSSLSSWMLSIAHNRAVSTLRKRREEAMDEETAAAARTRGVARSPGEDEAAKAKPQVVLSALTYEWRTVPERGINVILDFTAPATLVDCCCHKESGASCRPVS